ncbi:NAD(P)-binding domain-containing protein [bacterium]|nr:NAD(P)-binding domain-containing protein [bacterium]
MLEILVYVVVGLITLLIPLTYFLHEKEKHDKASATLQKALDAGLDQPVSLHPVIDPNTCIGSGSCVSACPEKDVLGLIHNRGSLINPNRCIGHGMCQAACPVDAITLVFGTEKRGVDIPHLTGKFETNVKGVYIAGELGGMGLIYNAVTQGIQAAHNIAESLEKKGKKDVHDLLIIGAGPAGIGASLQAKRENLDFIVLDQYDLGGTILSYPRRKLVMTRPMELPGYGQIKIREVQKENLLELFQDVILKSDLKVHSGRKVEEVNRVNGHFVIKTGDEEFSAQRVLLSIGRRGTPKKLNVPGEELPKVAYKLLEPERFAGQRILVVGGGDSAIEAAVALCEVEGTTVHLSYRGERVYRCKEENLDQFQRMVDAGKLTTLLESNVIDINEEEVTLTQNGKEFKLPNDQVFIFAGGELPTRLLEQVGVEFTRKFGEA